MTDLDETTLERLRTEGDQPAPLFEEPRRCLLDTCRAVLVRRENEELRRWVKRRFCPGLSCAMRHVNAGRWDDLPAEKTCPGCGVVFRPEEGMPPIQWRRKRYCSTTCGGATAPERPDGDKPRPRRNTKPKPATPSEVQAPPPVPTGPVWRPAGFSKIPNQWAGHRPPETDEVA
jgi:hypothetical protein